MGVRGEGDDGSGEGDEDEVGHGDGQVVVEVVGPYDVISGSVTPRPLQLEHAAELHRHDDGLL